MAAGRLPQRFLPLVLLGVMSCVPLTTSPADKGPETTIGARTSDTLVHTVKKSELRSIPPNAVPVRINFSIRPTQPFSARPATPKPTSSPTPSASTSPAGSAAPVKSTPPTGSP